MGFTPYQMFLIGLMLITGSISTLFTKWADRQQAHFCNETGEMEFFEHPFFQAVTMFLGEILCLLAFKFVWYSTARYRIGEMTYKGDASSALVRLWPINIKKGIRLVQGEQVFNPLIFWVASVCDILSTCLSYFALNLITAGLYRMLRGSVMVFTAILSILFLKKKLTIFNWLSIGTVAGSLAVIALLDLCFDKTPQSKHTNGEKVLGIGLILLAMMFTSLQVVYEERYINKYNIPPLQAVGWEGIFGFFTFGFLLIPFYFIRMPGSFTGPDRRLKDVPSAFCQMWNNYIIIIATIGNGFSIAVFSFAGISITKELSSTTRMVFDNGRILTIWLASLILKWQKFYLLSIGGFVFLIIGISIYNVEWKRSDRRFVSGESNDRNGLLPGYHGINAYTASPGSSSVPSGAVVYIALDKHTSNA
ncbi:unnamed protein product [Adineta steineri]|uniref:Solute carrier family 35 member F6 n=1 Tax=Adineta steineri TaxID=433720 RepID=A0A818T7L6_9BILA|nr:unnamed protein product [Adineta steineri]CAF3679883.1 unnamed protein product [Adineta steineri]